MGRVAYDILSYSYGANVYIPSHLGNASSQVLEYVGHA